MQSNQHAPTDKQDITRLTRTLSFFNYAGIGFGLISWVVPFVFFVHMEAIPLPLYAWIFHKLFLLAGVGLYIVQWVFLGMRTMRKHRKRTESSPSRHPKSKCRFHMFFAIILFLTSILSSFSSRMHDAGITFSILSFIVGSAWLTDVKTFTMNDTLWRFLTARFLTAPYFLEWILLFLSHPLVPLAPFIYLVLTVSVRVNCLPKIKKSRKSFT